MTDDYAFYREQTIKLIRQDGMNQARLDGHDEAIDRIEKAVNDGFAHAEHRTAELVNHIRGEIKTEGDRAARQREADMAAITASVDDIARDRANFQKSLSRVGWAIIAAVVAAAAAQTALSPQLAGMAAQALGQLQQ